MFSDEHAHEEWPPPPGASLSITNSRVAEVAQGTQVELEPAMLADKRLDLPLVPSAMPVRGQRSLPAGAESVPNVCTDGAALAPSNLEPERSSKQARGRYQRHQRADKARMIEAQMYLEMFDDADAVNPRPSQLDDDSVLSRQIFVEQPLVQRKKGFDKWITSGGRKGATDIWVSPQQGLRKRYGRVVRFDREKNSDSEKLKFAQYAVIRRKGADAPIEEVRGAGLFVLYPSVPEDDAVPGVLASTSGLSVHSRTRSSSQVAPPSLLLRADAGQQFISFGTEPTHDSPNSIELGAVVRADQGGVKLVSTQGDFAEWHRMVDGELSLSEGDVVGFHRGRISRNTRHCSMLGIVSRKAVVEGSAPPAHERHRYETVAYQGVVPVKVSNQAGSCDCPAPQAGQLLVPSGRHDGTAVLVPATAGVSRVGVLLDSSEYAVASGNAVSSWHLVQAVVVSPAETVVGSLARRAATLWRLALVVMLTAVVAAVVDSLEVIFFPHTDQDQAIEQVDSAGLDSNATENGTFTPSASGVFHRSCYKVTCWPYLERNAELDYAAIIYFPGMRTAGVLKAAHFFRTVCNCMLT
eukprot:COSAG02_NODE_5986_length_3888_cov_3.618105_2_plen_580_part_00